MSSQYDLNLLKSFGNDVYIDAGVIIRRPRLVSVGSHVAIDPGFYCTTQADMGDYIHIGPYVTIIGGAEASLTLRGFNAIGAGSRIACASDELLGEGLSGYSPPEYRDRIRYAPVVFEMFVTITTNVVVLPGVTLGEGSVVGACSLVKSNTDPWTIYAGIPARPLKPRRRDKMIEAARKLGYL